MIERQGRVEYRDPVLGAGVQINLVVARSGTADHEKVARARGESAFCHPRPKHDQAIDIFDMGGADLERVQPAPVSGVIGTWGQVIDEMPANICTS